MKPIEIEGSMYNANHITRVSEVRHDVRGCFFYVIFKYPINEVFSGPGNPCNKSHRVVVGMDGSRLQTIEDEHKRVIDVWKSNGGDQND